MYERARGSALSDRGGPGHACLLDAAAQAKMADNGAETVRADDEMRTKCDASMGAADARGVRRGLGSFLSGVRVSSEHASGGSSRYLRTAPFGHLDPSARSLDRGG